MPAGNERKWSRRTLASQNSGVFGAQKQYHAGKQESEDV